MMTQRAPGQYPLTRTDVGVYIGGLAVGLALTHIVIALSNGRVTVLATLTLAGAAGFVLAFMHVRRPSIAQRRYGFYLLHVIAFLMVNASFWLHALLTPSAGSSDEITGAWRGVLFAMPILWSIGLFIHTLGTLLANGYEHVEL